MKFKLTIAALLSASLLAAGACKKEAPPAEETAAPASTEKGQIEFTIKGVRNADGKVLMLLFKGGEGFPGDADTAVAKGDSEIKDGEAKIVFKDVFYGTYAVSMMHDEDGDSKLKTNAIGIPKEGSGASNDARGTMGPPKYEDAKFTLDSPKFTQTINMLYF